MEPYAPPLRSEPDPELEEILAEVRRIDVMSRHLVTDVMAGGYLSVFKGAGLAFEAVREYAPGDPERAVDWNVTARMGRPFIRTYQDERELSVHFVVDLSPSMSGGFGAWSLRQTAARVLAVLALSAVRSGDKVGLVTFHHELASHVPARTGFAHALRMVRDCLALPAGGGRSDIGPALGFLTRAVRRRGVVFVISDWLFDGYERALELLGRRHDVVAVRLLPPELVLPRVGLVRVRDPETGRTRLLDTDNRRVREAYAERTARWHAETRRRIAAAQVDLMDVPVPEVQGTEHVVGPILRFFRMRELRGTKR